VSFTFRRGPESKFARYGFVAQELERVLPSVVREKDDYKHVQYQDLIALLTLTAKAQQERLDSLSVETLELRGKVTAEQQERKKLQERLEKLEDLVTKLLEGSAALSAASRQ
jgi:septal ring factor EnvC (AmiA/AmiB activator)